MLLKADRRGLIVSMIHKFDGIPAKVTERRNVFVLVDEAHRTTGGDLGNYLMGALPNATYLGFTGTPIDRTAYGKGTFVIGSYTAPVLRCPPSRLNHMMKMMMGHIYWLSLRGWLEPLFDWYFARTDPDKHRKAEAPAEQARPAA